MKQQLIKLFEDQEITEVYSAIGYFSTDKNEMEKHLAGVHGHSVETITREQFEAMPDEEKAPKKVLTLEEQLARLDSKGIEAMIEKHSVTVKANDTAVEKLKAQGDKLDANKFQSANQALEKSIEDLTIMEEVLAERKLEELIYEQKNKKAKA